MVCYGGIYNLKSNLSPLLRITPGSFISLGINSDPEDIIYMYNLGPDLSIGLCWPITTKNLLLVTQSDFNLCRLSVGSYLTRPVLILYCSTFMYLLGLLSLYIRMEGCISIQNGGLPLVLVRLDIDAAVVQQFSGRWHQFGV